MSQGYSFSPANQVGPQLGFGPAPIEQNPMDVYGNPATGGMPTQMVTASPAPAPQGFQTSWEMAGYPTLDAWKTALGGTGGAQVSGGPAPLALTPAAGSKSQPAPMPIAMQPGQPQIGFGMPAPRLPVSQPISVNQPAANRYTRTRTRPINTGKLRPGFY